MALRSRSRTAAATSGPGRFPASDSRVRHRRPHSRARARQRHASAEELRRRAEALFAPEPGPGSGRGPGPEDGQRTEAWRESGADPPPVGAGEAAPAGRAEGAWRARVALAVRERMPLWMQTRCGLERRSVVALTVLLVVAVGFAVQHFWSGRTQSVQAPDVIRAAAPYGAEEADGGGGADGSRGRTDAGARTGAGAVAAAGAPGGAGAAGVAAGSAGSAGAEIVVDVSGKVRNPGIHRLPAGSRVADALEAAGGVKPGTDLTSLNRARFLVDGEQVVVGAPAPGGGAVTGPAGGAVAGPAGGAAAAGGPPVPVSLNSATVEQLDTLPGVGPVLAQHIVDYRTEHGGFRSVDELREVNGIGDRRFADLRNLVQP
ncbi:helix-hairpin-helix domain-containing protein [Streptomyces griseosporeus]|uniref:helix-hairpin-helix domain-containing protein n=1 Tax=Streptomyces griseosporeus TaxID=1910 RepID=UPI0036FAF723